MRHVSQESIALLRKFEQPVAQPFELVAQALQIDRAVDGDLRGEIAASQFADGTIDLPQRAAQSQCEQQHHDHTSGSSRVDSRNSSRAGDVGPVLQRADVSVDLLVAKAGDAVGELSEHHEGRGQFRGFLGRASVFMTRARIWACLSIRRDNCALASAIVQLLPISATTMALSLAVVIAKCSQHAVVAEHLIEPGGTSEQRNLRVQVLRQARGLHAVRDQRWLVSARRRICTAACRIASSSGPARTPSPSSRKPFRDLGSSQRIESFYATKPAHAASWHAVFTRSRCSFSSQRSALSTMASSCRGAASSRAASVSVLHGDQYRRIAGPARLLLDVSGFAGHPLDAVEHLAHAVAVAVATLRRWRRHVADNRAHHMGACEILDVNVVAHAGAVRRVVVGAEDRDVRPFATDGLDRRL